MTGKRVIVIGAGSTGCATAHDLTLRGFEVVVVERGDIASGTTGRCTCDIHSGARYAVKDPESAIEVIEENQIIRRIMSCGVIEENGGLFLLLPEDDVAYADRFFDNCAACGIQATEITPREVFAREPNITREVLRAAIVPDAIVDPLRFTLSFAATARVGGARFLCYTEVKEMQMAGNRVTGVRVLDRIKNEVYDLPGDMVVNAAGPWADKIAALAGIRIRLALSPGIHVIIGVRLTHLALNRMHIPGSGDFLGPIRNQSVLGTSSWTVQDCDYLHIPPDHVESIRQQGCLLVPVIARLPTLALNAAARPLIAAEGGTERELSRTFEAFDHAVRDDVEGFVTIAGGKMCTARAMAEKISDVVCRRLGVDAPCQTHSAPLTSFRRYYTG